MENKSSEQKRVVSIFGSTGSIGKSVIKLIMEDVKRYEILALTANNNVELLIEQAKLLKPKFAIIANDSLYFSLRKGLEGSNVSVMSGEQALLQIASMKCDAFVSAIYGNAAIKPTLNAVKAGSNIALANKECLTIAGTFFNYESQKSGVNIIPIDESHNAVFQCLERKNRDKVKDIVITSTGGPFKEFTLEEMKGVKPEQTIIHPSWLKNKQMFVNLATMMNEGLQFIEAHHLFDLSPDKIKIIIHPEKIVKGMVNYIDGSCKALLHHSDIKIAICDSINYPERTFSQHEYLDLTEVSKLTFEEINRKHFPAVDLCMSALKEGGNIPCALNTANEVAVKAFLNNEIKFLDIYFVVYDSINKIYKHKVETLEDVLECDAKAREVAKEVLSKYKR